MWLQPLKEVPPSVAVAAAVDDDDNDEICTQPQILEVYNNNLTTTSSSGVKRDINMISNSIPSKEIENQNIPSILKKNKLTMTKDTTTSTTMNASNKQNNIQSASSLQSSEGTSIQSISVHSTTTSLQHHQRKQLQQQQQQVQQQQLSEHHHYNHHHQQPQQQQQQQENQSLDYNSEDPGNKIHLQDISQQSSSKTKYFHKQSNRINYHSIPLNQPLSKQFLDKYYSHRDSYACNNNIKDEPYHLSEPPLIPKEMMIIIMKKIQDSDKDNNDNGNNCSITAGLRYSLLNDEQIRSICNNNEYDIFKCYYMADIERKLQKRNLLHCLSRY